ncbi:MAG: peptidoglycan DD-metalloendopeptidase family protein, partial [Rikenellaceae bacterium]|nr:peptidoglycan DD-metalloendopeptidase family protein [Rikenellaceae bacterium]
MACAGTNRAEAQRSRTRIYTPPKLEDLPQRPLDTLSTADPDTKIVLFSNNTWKYLLTNTEQFDEMEVFREHWDTSQVFAYKSIELKDLPPVVDINLIRDLSDYRPPIVGHVFSKYGRRGRRNHNGVDIPLRIGEPICAAFDGKVRYAKFNTGGFGNLVIVRHKNGLETWYAHLSKLNVGHNDYVKAGQVIGFGGSTGRSRGPHLHFEMRYCDQTFDPEFIIDFETGNLRYQTFALEKSFFNIHSRATDQLEDDDDYDFPMLTENLADTVSSEDILEHIARAQQPKAANGPELTQGNAVYHVIRSGDMLSKLAIRYGVTVRQ